MTASVYVQPIAFASGPQVEDGAAIRLGGSLVYASRFALIVRDEDKVIERRLFGVREAAATLETLDGALGRAAQQQWDNFAKASCRPTASRMAATLMMPKKAAYTPPL